MAETTTFKVTGMTCDHCVRAVTSAIEGVEGVSSAKVDLAEASAVVEGEQIKAEEVIAAVREEGYEAEAVA